MCIVYVRQSGENKFMATMTDLDGDFDFHSEEGSSEAEALSRLNKWFASNYPNGTMKVERRSFLTSDEHNRVRSRTAELSTSPLAPAFAIYELFNIGGGGPWRGGYYKSWTEDFPKK